MSVAHGKSLRLSFKGDTPKKRKRTRDKHGHGESSSSKARKRRPDGGGADGSDVEDVDGNEQAWVPVQSELDLSGPCFLFQLSLLEQPTLVHCLAFQPTLQSVEAAPIQAASDAASTEEDQAALLAANPQLADQLEGAEIVGSARIDTATVTPQSVYQVWVATKVPGSSSPTRFTFKSAEGKFLGASKDGRLNASMEARGPQEEWTLETSGRAKWMLRSIHGRYLALDQVAGGKTVVRADAQGPMDPTASWSLKVQWKHRHAARYSADAKETLRSKANDPTARPRGTRDQVLAQELETFRSRAGSHYLPAAYESSLSKAERKELRRAQKEGRLAEEMLDRRSKLKSDRYA